MKRAGGSSCFRIGVEDKGVAVDAVSQTCRRRAILKDMAEMSIATGTADFRPAHEVRVILVFFYRFFGRRSVKARPAAMRLEFGFRTV